MPETEIEPRRERLRGLIGAAVAARGPQPVARRTLELLVRSGVARSEAEPGYRIVDRDGAVRTLPEAEGGPERPMTLDDLVAELAARHPALFLPRVEAPAENTAPAAPEAPPRGAELRRVAARFFGRRPAQDAAASPAKPGDAPSGPAAAPAASPPPRPEPALAETAPAAPPIPERAAERAVPERQAAGRAVTAPLSLRLAEGAQRAARKTARQAGEGAAALRGLGSGASPRALLAACGVGALALVGVLVLALPQRPATQAPAPVPETPKPVAEATRNPPPAGAEPAPPSTAIVPSPPPAPIEEKPPAPPAPAPVPVTPPPEDVDPPPPVPGDIVGRPEVVDTATLRIGGKLVRLFGVEWVRGGQAADLTRYLAGRSVSCRRAPGSETYLCEVEGRDLSEVVLFNGGGRASSEASPELVAAEDHARSERLGVWKR